MTTFLLLEGEEIELLIDTGEDDNLSIVRAKLNANKILWKFTLLLQSKEILS